MTPELAQALERITVLENQLKQFQNVAELDPQIQRTIIAVVGALNTLDSLSDVVISTPSVGQVLKYDGANWVNGTDNT
jgi:uncharacterized protein YigA (DUF484 family)